MAGHFSNFFHNFLGGNSNTSSGKFEGDDEPESSCPIEHSNKYNPTVDDVLALRHYLLRFVPQELVDIIIDTAAYWPCISAEGNLNYVLHATSAGNNASTYCILTPVIPHILQDRTLIPIKLQRVKFTIQSCDQGWGGESEHQGTYRASYTWFEAAIIQGDVKGRLRSILPADKFNALAFSQTNPLEIENGFEVSRRWHLQRNVHVSSTVRWHEVVWTKGEIIDKHSAAEAEADGRGTGRGFIDTLSSGHRVAVVARAQYPGWANHITRVSVDVFYSI